MRVTNNAFSGAFLNSYNSLLSSYLKSQTKILTQRKYNRASEDSASAAKAAHVRKSLDNLDIYDENLKTAKDFFYAAEDALYDVADKTYLNVKQKIVSVQDTMSQTEFNTIALELEQQAEHMIQDMNTDFATRQMFGSASNDKTPFTVYSRVEITLPGSTEPIVMGNQYDTAALANVKTEFLQNPQFTTTDDQQLTDLKSFNTGDKLKLNGKTVTFISETQFMGEDGTLYTEPPTEIYDESGELITDLSKYDGKVYYSSSDITAADTIKFTVNKLRNVPDAASINGKELTYINDDTLSDEEGNTYTVPQKFYDENHNEITDIDNYLGDVYYSSAYPDDPTTIKFTVNKLKNAPDEAVTNSVALTYDFAQEGYTDATGKLYTSTGKYYDSDGNEIINLNSFEGKVYYNSPDKNASGTLKFTVNGSPDFSSAPTDRVVCFNDIPVDLMGDDLKEAVNGGVIKYFDKEGKVVKQYDNDKNVSDTKTIKCPSDNGGAYGFPGTNPIYVDIGLGVKYDENGVINPATALDIGLNGAEITGCGTDKDNDSLNLMQLVFDAADALRKGDLERINRYIDKLDEANSKVLDAITTLGVKQNNMQMYIDRNDVYRLNLSEKQNTIEGVDIEEEITNMKSIEAAYNASLSLGSGIIPKSIFDFV